MKVTTVSSLLLVTVFVAFVSQSRGQQNAKPQVDGPVPSKKISELKFKHQDFTFVRIKYSNAPSTPALPSTWMTDYPDADLNFTARFQKETGLKCEDKGRVMPLTNSELSQFPFIYISEGGRLLFSDAEVASLRSYLTGGGFLMVDDFWGEKEWSALQEQLKRVFPDRDPIELPIDHPLFHCYYDIKEKPQVPNVMLGIDSQFTGVTWEREDAKEAHYRGLFDNKGRLMVVFCHNTDLADGWERQDKDAYYFREFSLKKAYPMGINIVVYALTHLGFASMSVTAENQKGSRRSLRIPLTLLIAVVAYILSIGPVGTIATRLGLGTRLHRPLRVFYAPVFAVARSSAFGTRVYEDYVRFWGWLVLNQPYPKHQPDPPVENLIAAIGSITNGQTSFQIFVPSKLSQGGYPTFQDVALEQIIGKVREHGLFPAGFQQQPDGRLYTFEREREWERKSSD